MSKRTTRRVAFSASNKLGGADVILHQLINRFPIELAILHAQMNGQVNINKPVYWAEFASIERRIGRLLYFILRYPRTIVRLNNVIQHADEIICNDFLALVYAAPFVLLKKARLVFYCHSAFRSSVFNRMVTSFFINLTAHKTIVPSFYLKTALTRVGIKEARIHLLYNGLPSTHSAIDKLSPPPLRVGIFGAITPQKGQDVFINALNICSEDTNVAIEGFVVGGVLDRAFEERLKASVGKSTKVVFSGFLNYDESQQLMGTMDIVVCASKEMETLPTVLIESLRAGVAVIGTNIGGVPEIIVNQQNGLLIEPNDSKGMAAAILKLSDMKIRKKMIDCGYIVFTEKFSLESYLSKLSHILT